MTASPTPVPDTSDPQQVVGNRVLVGVQMINISRLSTHPVPITTSGLITVAGQGPTDSNGAGKSSFIAGLSLLHADDQWRLQSGAQAAAELLFTAELAGQEAMHANADRGYIIGVFAPPAVQSVPELDPAVLTVWLRINRQSPHIELRWAQRLHVAYGETEDERAASADTLWDALPRSNGRTDIRANKLAKALYGDTVRCVSFLSTSVRASPTANLLAQPLNELTPERIFDAIGALTGLSTELEGEQKARSREHADAANAKEAREQYDEWDARMSVVEQGIRTRQRAREVLDEARNSWRSRCARYLTDGLDEDEGIAVDLKNNEQARKEIGEGIDTVKSMLGTLTDDKSFERSFRDRVDRYQQLTKQVDALKTEHAQNVREIEMLAIRKRDLDSKATAADGLTPHEAALARAKAETELGTAQQARGITDAALRAAQTALAAAERGDDVASAQVHTLRSANIDTAPLIDVITLPDGQRAVWEARLLPYRQAIVVRHEDATTATKLLAGLPGSLIVSADPHDHPAAGTADLPATDPAYPLTSFLSALADRAGAGSSHIDLVAGVHSVSGFADPLTGRAGRIRQARAAVEAAADADDDAEAAVTAARQTLKRAQEREQAAQAAVEAAELTQRIQHLRDLNEANDREQGKLATPLALATEHYRQALADKQSRDTRIEAVRSQLNQAEGNQKRAEEAWHKLMARRDELDLPGRHTAWGGTVDTARQHLLQLNEAERNMSLPEWDYAADDLADRVRRACFPIGTPSEHLPEELRVIDQQRDTRRTAERIRLIPAMLRVVGTYLDQHEQVDKQQKADIERQRADKTATLTSAEAALSESREAAAAVRATLATAVKAKLKLVSAEFDRIDKAYDGYGGELEFPEPEPPADPDKPWRWSVTPKWRRSEGKPPASYRLRGNTAQMDDKAVKLVCAAALAGSGDKPLLLVLDELGRNLGAAHRRAAVALFENIGRDRSISVVGALQDDMERYAIAASSLYIKLRRSSDTMPYNQAPVIIGSDSNRARVQMLTDWLTSYRPDPQP
ncbi:hypothetical protein [Salinispora arenicola]|uniref:hypothetical protein n=1 Tax=Salinispora arenicola TaxID=168697 RepID=UPI0020798D6A|nr:hypothetical protein [Salinispora arenicola]MCN0178637.1 hypothetical protein [Salinispora arenicola]